MITLHRKNRDRSEHGIALAIAMLVLLLVSSVLVGMIVMANSETNTSANFRDEQTAFFASRAGVEEVRDRLRTTSSNVITPPSALPGTSNGILYITNPLSGETVAPWNTTGSNYPDDEICFEVPCTGGVPAGGSTWHTNASAGSAYVATPLLAWKWVRMMPKINKPSASSKLLSLDGTTGGQRVCWNGTNEVVTTNPSCQDKTTPNYYPVYSLTALAATSSGSRRMTQYEITPAGFPTLPGALIFDGSAPVFGAPNSGAFAVSGTDVAQGPNAGANCAGGVNQPALGTTSGTDATNLGNDKTVQKRAGNYTSGSATTPAISDVGSTLSGDKPNLSTVDGLVQLVSMVTIAAGNNVYGPSPLPSSSTINMGTNSSPVINVVNGPFSPPSGGAGILLVTGDLTLNGNFSYNGIILVIGTGKVTKNGGGGGTQNGALLVANMNDSSGNPIPLGASPNNKPGTPTIDYNGGGNSTIQYDSCWVNNVVGGFPLKLLSMRELIYR